MYSNSPDEFCDDPRVVEAGNAAFGLFSRAWIYSGRELTNGFVPKSIALMYGKPAEIKALIANGLWTVGAGNDTHGPENSGRDGYTALDYTAHNLDHVAVRAKRAATIAARQENGRRGGKTTAERKQTGKQTSEFASSGHEQTVQQTDEFAAPFATENPSKRAAPGTRDQEPDAHTSQHHHQLRDTPDDGGAGLHPDLRTLIERCADVFYAKTSSSIGSTVGWRRSVIARLWRDRGREWSDALTDDADWDDLIADETKIPRAEVQTIRRRSERIEVPV